MIDPAAREALRAVLGERVRFDEPMARQVSLRPPTATSSPPCCACAASTACSSA